MQKIIAILIFITIPVVLLAQQNPIADSLLKVLANAKTDTTKANLYYALADQYRNSEPAIARSYIVKGSELSTQLNYKRGIIKSYKMFSALLSYQSKFDSVLYYNKMVLDIARSDNDSFNIGVAFFNIGAAYRFMSELDSAVKYTLAGARILEGKGYNNIEAILNDGLQTLYMTLGQYDKAIEFGNKAVALAKKIDDKKQIANALNNLGLSYSDQNNLIKARQIFNEAITVAKADGNKSIEGAAINNISDIALREGDFDILKSYAERSIQLFTEMQDDAGMVDAKLILAASYLTHKDFIKAQSLANEALQLAKKQNLLDETSTALGMLSHIAFVMQDYKNGFKYFSERDDAQTKAFNESMQQKEVTTRVKYETEKKDNQI